LKKPDIPRNEQSRLKSLRSLDILDTPPEERFDRYTRMAKRMFGVPIALVSLVDENRQWFKSCFGLPVRETPRDIFFCGHAILGKEVFVIPDALQDERFADNPLVTEEPHIRFYAGCPLSSLDGSKLGTLCIIDQEPREFTEEDIDTLHDLASMVEQELAALEMATVDELTGITNRRGFMSLSQYILNLCIREKLPATLAFIDLNEFKLINDTYGHAEGDRALIEFSNELKGSLRNSDLFARLGGDEFTILLANTTCDDAELVIRKLSKSLKDYYNNSDHPYELTFSYGVVEFNPQTHQSLEDLLHEGDELMYQKKRQTKF